MINVRKAGRVSPRRSRVVIALAMMMVARASPAAEGDVHFGLTQFLAIRAGFEPSQAVAIATGDQRVESGEMRHIALVLDYACFGHDAELSVEAGVRSFPTMRVPPAIPAERTVAAGSPSGHRALDQLGTEKASEAGFRLSQFGTALHGMQASFFHEGLPAVPVFNGYGACDETLAWGHPKARGGWNSHAADLTSLWPSETMRMAAATYGELQRFPSIGPLKRQAAPWSSVSAELSGFVAAATKATKKRWFEAHGISDVSFLSGTSLPDGDEPFASVWEGRRLPQLGPLPSRQHEVDPSLLEFFSRFIADWMLGTDPGTLATAADVPSFSKRAGPDQNRARELRARLSAWMLIDHGAVAALAHKENDLTDREVRTVATLYRSERNRARYPNPVDGLFPLVTNGKTVSPLLPFIVRTAGTSPQGNQRMVAIAKLRHAPYDSVGIVAEQSSGQWRVVKLLSAVDH